MRQISEVVEAHREFSHTCNGSFKLRGSGLLRTATLLITTILLDIALVRETSDRELDVDLLPLQQPITGHGAQHCQEVFSGLAQVYAAKLTLIDLFWHSFHLPPDT